MKGRCFNAVKVEAEEAGIKPQRSPRPIGRCITNSVVICRRTFTIKSARSYSY
jgi:hypothetical protein